MNSCILQVVKLKHKVLDYYIDVSLSPFQVTFVSSEPIPPEFSRTVKFGNMTYSLYSHSFLHFGQVNPSFYEL